MTIRNTFAGLFLTWTSVGLFGQDTLIIPEAIVQSNFSETPEAAPRNLVSLDAEVIAGVA